METSTQAILDGVDARVDAWLPVIHDVQAAYFAEHGRYAQSLLMASTHPRDGNNTPLDRPAAHPTDQAESPQDLFPGLPGLLRGNVRIDVYHGSHGHGYVVVCYHERTGGPDTGLWTKDRNYGPETWRDSSLRYPDAKGWYRAGEVQ